MTLFKCSVEGFKCILELLVGDQLFVKAPGGAPELGTRGVVSG